MADGSAVLVDGAMKSAHAINADAADLWEEDGGWTEEGLTARLEGRGYSPGAARPAAAAFIESLRLAGLLVDDADR
jgi:hypothetical protein